MGIIDFKNVSFGYNGEVVLEDITFQIEKGKYVGIIGPNGGGKSTLLKLLLGLLEPTKGEVRVLGKLAGNVDVLNKIGYVPQHITQLGFDFPASVEEIVKSGLIGRTNFMNNLSDQQKQDIEEALNLTGLINYKNKRLNELSGGMRQRVFVARALAAQPEILILDEPFAGIDVASQQNFYQLLKNINQNNGITIIFVSHDVDIITKEASEVLCLNQRLVCDLPSEQIDEEELVKQLYGKTFTHIHKHY